MIRRGSLKQCIAAAIDRYKADQWAILAILANEAGKYYTLLTAQELHDEEDSRLTAKHRLLFHGSKKEFMAFVNSDQRDLFNGTESDPDALPN